MDKLPKSQVAKIVLFLFLLIFIPFISRSLRPSYLYFLFNILIIALGIEAGFLNIFSRPQDHKNAVTTIASPINTEAVHDATSNSEAKVTIPEQGRVQAVTPAEELGVGVSRFATRVQKVKRCSSKPSLFFIGSSEVEGVKEEEDEEEEEKWVAGELSKQELFAKAETFIGNFYEQLKMQREESRKKMHGLYHRAF